MKLSSNAVALLVLSSSASAFVPQRQLHPTHKSSQLEASPNKAGWWGPVATVAAGWTLATQIATASLVPQAPPTHQELLSNTPYPSHMVAAGAYIPEEGYDSLDMSMPSYNVEAPVDVSVPDPEKEAEKAAREAAKAKAKAEREEAKFQEMVAKKEAKAKSDAEKQQIRAKAASERQAKLDAKAAKEAEKNMSQEEKDKEKIRAFLEKQKAKADAKAEKQRIMEKVAADRKAKKEAKDAEKLAREQAAGE